MPHPLPDPTKNPRQDDRHHLTGVKQRGRLIEALNTFNNTKISKAVKTNSDAAETAMSAALRKAVRRKAVAQ